MHFFFLGEKSIITMVDTAVTLWILVRIKKLQFYAKNLCILDLVITTENIQLDSSNLNFSVSGFLKSKMTRDTIWVQSSGSFKRRAVQSRWMQKSNICCAFGAKKREFIWLKINHLCLNFRVWEIESSPLCSGTSWW